jgi:3-oxoacyl-[acyl-carrier-protein] synthase-3
MITGLGAVVPEKILTNHDLAEMVDTSDEWILTRTGIRERHIAENGKATSDYAADAARLALENAKLPAEEIEMIIFGTVTPDMYFPSAACFLQEKIGAVNATAFDISAACTGFIYGLSIADSMISAGRCKNVLVIGAELLSRITNWEDRATCVLFGDGAGVAVVQPSDGKYGIINTHIKSDGRLTYLLNMPGGGSMLPPAKAKEDPEKFYLRMEGPEVFRHAVTKMGDAATYLIEQNGFSGEEIKLVIPHQANIRIIEAITKRLAVPEDRVYVNVDRFGNTSAASIPIALYEASQLGKIQKNDLVLLVAFGGGFTWGSALIRF